MAMAMAMAMAMVMVMVMVIATMVWGASGLGGDANTLEMFR
jgi:hypothetical protein